MKLQWNYNIITMELQWNYNETTMKLQWNYNDNHDFFNENEANKVADIGKFFLAGFANPNKPRSATFWGVFKSCRYRQLLFPGNFLAGLVLRVSEQSGNLLDSKMVLGVIASCPCNTTTMPWTDSRKDAALWVRNIWDNRLWAAAFPDCHPLFKLEGVGILALGADLMHIKHLGTDQYFLGSVLHLLVYSMMPGIAAANLEEVWRLCLEFFSRHRVTSRFANLKLSMFVNTVHPHVDYPKLKGKAAEMRSLGPALHHVWCNKMDGSIAIHRQVELALRCCADIDTILDDNRDVVKLPPGAATKFQDNVFNFLSLLNAVATHFTIKQVRLFNLTIKCHYLAHIGFHAENINPRLCWCYAGEDLMNKVKVLTQSCLKGTHASKVFEKLLPKIHDGPPPVNCEPKPVVRQGCVENAVKKWALSEQWWRYYAFMALLPAELQFSRIELGALSNAGATRIHIEHNETTISKTHDSQYRYIIINHTMKLQ